MIRLKKVYIGVVFMLSAALLGGCAPQVTELSDSENLLVAEYVSSLLLKYDKHYKARLDYFELDQRRSKEKDVPTIDELVNGQEDASASEAAKEPSQTDAVASDGTQAEAQSQDDGQQAGEAGGGAAQTPPQATPVLEVKVSKIFRGLGVGVKLAKWSLKKDYMEGDGALLIAPGNRENRLLLVEFHVKNQKKGTNKVRTGDKIQYGVQSSSGSYEALVSMLENGGLNRLDTTLPRGGSEKALLIFEVPKDFKAKGARIQMMRGEDTASVALK